MQRQKLLSSTSNQKDTTMKKIIMLAGFATLLASPSFAQSYSPSYGTGNIIKAPSATSSATGAFAYEPSRSRAYDGPRHYYDRPYKYHRHSGHHQYRHWSEF